MWSLLSSAFNSPSLPRSNRVILKTSAASVYSYLRQVVDYMLKPRFGAFGDRASVNIDGLPFSSLVSMATRQRTQHNGCCRVESTISIGTRDRYKPGES